MLNPILKPSLDWKNVAKQALLASGSVLTAYLTVAVLTSSEADRTKRLAALGFVGLGGSSVIGLQNRKIRQLKKSEEQAQQQVQEKEKQFQERESSLITEKNQLLELQKDLEQQLQQKKEKVAEIETKLKQQQEASQKLKQQKQEIETFFTEENNKLLQAKVESEQQFKQQENQYLQDIENLEEDNKRLKQKQYQLQEQINSLNCQLEIITQDQNNATTSSASLSDLKIALVGGHPTACNQVKQQLKEKNNFTKIKLFPKQKNTPSKKRIKQQVKNADFIFIITGYNEHPVSEHVYNLQQADQLQGNIIHISDCRGQTGIYNNILNYL